MNPLGTKEKNVVAPTKTDIRKKAVVEALKKTLGVVTQAVNIAGVDRSQFYEWIKTDPVFKRRVQEIDDIALDFVESKLYKQIEEGNTAATIFYLKTKGKKRGYIEKQQIELGGKINTKYESVSDQDLEKLIRELEALNAKFK